LDLTVANEVAETTGSMIAMMPMIVSGGFDEMNEKEGVAI